MDIFDHALLVGIQSGHQTVDELLAYLHETGWHAANRQAVGQSAARLVNAGKVKIAINDAPPHAPRIKRARRTAHA